MNIDAVSGWLARHVAVHQYANPYRKCGDLSCQKWITGYAVATITDDIEMTATYPCGHRSGYVDLCPSWGPVDGCQCRKIFGIQEHGVPSGPFPPGVVR